jgi:hypothetical protein
VACDWAAQTGDGVGGACYLTRDADMGAFRLAYAAGRPLAARFKPQAPGLPSMAVPLKVQGPLAHRHRRTIRPVAGVFVLRPLLDPLRRCYPQWTQACFPLRTDLAPNSPSARGVPRARPCSSAGPPVPSRTRVSRRKAAGRHGSGDQGQSSGTAGQAQTAGLMGARTAK